MNIRLENMYFVFMGLKTGSYTYIFLLLITFIQLWENIKFLKQYTLGVLWGDRCVASREKELKVVIMLGHLLSVLTVLASLGFILAVSNSYRYIIVFKPSIVGSPGCDYSSELKLRKP